MKFFATFEILQSVLLAAAAGLIFGCVYRASERIFFAFGKLLSLIPSVISTLGNFSRKAVKEKIRRKNTGMATPLMRNLFEAIVFLIFGIATLLLFYIALDGVFRVYVLITVVIFFVFAKRSLGKAFADIFDRIFFCIYYVLFISVGVILIPMYKLTNGFLKVLKKFYIPVSDKIRQKHSRRLIKTKIKDAGIIN